MFQARPEQLASLRAERSAMRSLWERSGDQGDSNVATEPSRGGANGRRALSDLMRGMRSGLAGTGRIAGFRDADFGDFFGRDSAALDPRNYLVSFLSPFGSWVFLLNYLFLRTMMTLTVLTSPYFDYRSDWVMSNRKGSQRARLQSSPLSNIKIGHSLSVEVLLLLNLNDVSLQQALSLFLL